MTRDTTLEDFESFLLAGGTVTLDEWAALDGETREAASEAGRRVAEFRGECVASALLDAQAAIAAGLVERQEDARIHGALELAVKKASRATREAA